MAFIETPTFPDTLAYGARGGPTWLTQLVVPQSGHEKRTRKWSQQRMRWQVGLQNRSASETITLIGFFNAVAVGRLNGFRFRDPSAGESAGTDEPIGVGDGVDTTFQLSKRYTAGAFTYDRTITKPVSGTVTCKVNGVPTAAFTVNTATGVVTFTAAPGNTLPVTASFTFDVPVRFDVDILDIEIISKNDSIGAYSWGNIPIIETRDIA